MSVIHRFFAGMEGDCPQPLMIRTLVHPVTKQLVLLGGEYHKYITKIGEGRVTSTLYYRMLSEITRKTLLNKDENSPFRKVLLLSEHAPVSENIELFGGALELDLFQDINEDYPLLIEAFLQMAKIANRYPSKFLYRGTDFRNIFDAKPFVLYFLYGKINPIHERPSDKYMETLIRVMFSIVLQDYDLENTNDKEKESETNNFLEKLESSEKIASKTFRATKDELEGFKSYFTKFIRSVTETDESGNVVFKKISDNDFRKVYRPLFYSLNFLMDLYTMNYILRMPGKTLTVFFGGIHHTERIFNLLCNLHGFRLLETELTFKPVVGTCHVLFPETSESTIALIRKYNEKTREVYQKYIQETEKNKKRFIINLIEYRNTQDSFISLPIDNFTTYHENLTLSYFGTYAQFIDDSSNQEKLFTTFIPWETND